MVHKVYASDVRAVNKFSFLTITLSVLFEGTKGIIWLRDSVALIRYSLVSVSQSRRFRWAFFPRYCICFKKRKFSVCRMECSWFDYRQMWIRLDYRLYFSFWNSELREKLLSLLVSSNMSARAFAFSTGEINILSLSSSDCEEFHWAICPLSFEFFSVLLLYEYNGLNIIDKMFPRFWLLLLNNSSCMSFGFFKISMVSGCFSFFFLYLSSAFHNFFYSITALF